MEDEQYKNISSECKKKLLGGRPTKYRKEFPEMLLKYFDKPATEIVETYDKSGNLVTVERAVALPTMAGFACEIYSNKQTVYNWINKTNDDGTPYYPEFVDAYKFAKGNQEKILNQNALNGQYKENYAKFLQTNFNREDYQDTKQQDIAVHVTGVAEIASDMDDRDASHAYNQFKDIQ